MSNTLLTKLRRRFSRTQGTPISVRLRQDAMAAARFVTHAAVASSVLHECNKVGAWVRTPGGKPLIQNLGYIEVGAHVILSSMFCPVQLTSGRRGRLSIGDACNINFGCVISATQDVKLGRGVSVGPYSIIADSPLELGTPLPEPIANAAESAPIEIGDDVWLAGRVTVLPGTRIGAGSVITAGSIVSGEIPPGVLAGGIPARVLRSLSASDDAARARSAAQAAPLEASSLRLLPQSAAAMKPPGAETHAQPTAAPKPERKPALATHRALLISDFTIQELADHLTEDQDAPVLEVDVAPYQQVIPSLMGLTDDAADLVVVWTLAEHSIPSFRRLLGFESVSEQTLLEEVDAFADLLVRSLTKVKCGVVPTWTLPAYNRGLGVLDLRPGGVARALLEMNKRLADRLQEHSHIHVLNAQRWVEHAGKSGRHPKLWYMGKVAYNDEVLKEAAQDIKAALSAAVGGARKLLVVDLDDTLWGGTVGDVGWEGLRLGGHDSLGEAFVDFQHALKNLKRRGIVLAIASKNEESVALEAIRNHSEMVLREEDFAAHRINWVDKARNVRELALELNLGLQSVVFIDDNPVERARVRDALPEVLVPEWPEDKHLYASALLSLRCFDNASISREDMERTSMLQAERVRESLIPELGSLDEWVKSLQMQLIAEPLAAANLARTVQLLNKTNQLNLSTRRLSENELKEWAADERRELWCLRVTDRFGDSGLTGIVSIEADGSEGRIVDYILSCRVMGRKVEESLLHIAVVAAQRRGLSRLRAELLPTPKNKPCKTFWLRSGFERHGENGFSWDLSRSYQLPDGIALDIVHEVSS